MRILVNGAGGHMGRILCDLVQNGAQNSTLAGAVDVFNAGNDFLPSLQAFAGDADCLIDFSHHTAVVGLVEFAVARKMPLVIATTGHTEDEISYIHEAAKEIPVFFSANMSLGIAVLAQLVKTAARFFPDADIEIVEQHHNRKLDVPSGTALLLGKALQQVRPNATLLIGRHVNGKRTKDEIGIHSLRMGDTVGIHEVIINAGTQTLSLKHEAHNRALFAEGALVAASFVAKMGPGLYDMNALVEQM